MCLAWRSWTIFVEDRRLWYVYYCSPVSMRAVPFCATPLTDECSCTPHLPPSRYPPCSVRKRNVVARILRKQKGRLLTKSMLIWKIVMIAEGLVGQQVAAAAASTSASASIAANRSTIGPGQAELLAAAAQQHNVLRSLAARMSVHVEAAFRLLGAFGFLPKYVAAPRFWLAA